MVFFSQARSQGDFDDYTMAFFKINRPQKTCSMIMKLNKCLFLYKMSLVLCYKNPARTDYLAFISNIGSLTVVTNKPQFVLRYLTSFWVSQNFAV